MARPRTPSNVLEARDAFRKHPERRREDIQGVGEVGDPPDWMQPEEAQAWRELVERAPKGVFTGSDRFALEAMAQQVAQIRRRELKGLAELRQWLGQYGFTAAARAKISVTPEKPESRFSEFAS